jgi:hypothetical protein
MPRIDVIFYQEDEDDVPVLDWLKDVRRLDQRAYETCVAAIERLGEFGHELRRPLADFLKDGNLRTAGEKGPGELPNPLFLSQRESRSPRTRANEGERGAEGRYRAGDPSKAGIRG